jgi:hypothetical protein
MYKIVGVRKNETGDITDVKLDNGQTMPLCNAVSMSENNEIEGVIVGTDRAGGKYLHSKRGQYDYKLAELPEF